METSPTFMKWRMCAFCWTILASLLYIIMLCIITYARWEFFDRSEKSCVVVLLLVNTINTIMLPILVMREFRVWLDAARMGFLLVANIGIAGFFTYYNSRFQCPETTPDDQGNCQLLNICILMASWVTPALLATYSACLAFWVWWRTRHPKIEFATEDCPSKIADEEASIGQPLPVAFPQTRMMGLRRPPLTIMIPTPTTPIAVVSRTPSAETYSSERDPYYATRDRKKSLGAESARSVPPKSARLSKQRPPPSILY